MAITYYLFEVNKPSAQTPAMTGGWNDYASQNAADMATLKALYVPTITSHVTDNVTQYDTTHTAHIVAIDDASMSTPAMASVSGLSADGQVNWRDI